MQWIVRLVVYCTFGYLGTMLAMRSNRDEFSLIIPYLRFARETTQHEPLIIDTNIIIDGRIATRSARLARLQQVPVLNLADLARALRPMVVAGDELELNLIRKGSDHHQAVG